MKDLTFFQGIIVVIIVCVVLTAIDAIAFNRSEIASEILFFGLINIGGIACLHATLNKKNGLE